jgi:hypothetical protein
MKARNPILLDRLLDCRMAILGLDLADIESQDRHTLDVITHRCAKCEFREACEIDLERDPNDPVWESYCPNTPILMALAQA